MKRQGRQHGMVQTYPVLPAPWGPRGKPSSRNELTAGLFSKVSSKPTNHSKFTGKCCRSRCNDCHVHPACKSKDKAKGAGKMRSSSDAMSSYRLITWRVVDAPPGLVVSGFSVKGVLDYLDSDESIDGCGYEEEFSDDDREMRSRGVLIEEDDGYAEINHGAAVDGDDDDGMSFCEVGFVWETVDGDESWCVVEEM